MIRPGWRNLSLMLKYNLVLKLLLILFYFCFLKCATKGDKPPTPIKMSREAFARIHNLSKVCCHIF